jgi:hypothetical protein
MGHRITCEDITGQAENGCSPEQIAGPDIYPELDVDVVRRVLLFAYVSELNLLTKPGTRPDLARASYYRIGVLVNKVGELSRALRGGCGGPKTGRFEVRLTRRRNRPKSIS